MFARFFDNLGAMRRTGWSIAAHVAVLVLLFRSGPAVRVRSYLPGTPRGARIELSYLPGSVAASPKRPERKQTPAPVEKSKLALPSRLAPAPANSAEASQPSPGESSASSNDALGTEDIRIALTTFSPSPRPDLSRLPRGAQGEVVLDVTIDPTGQVADLEILRTLGYGVEGAVADTVRTWKFSPATKDGVPVASVQELHFHYGPV